MTNRTATTTTTTTHELDAHDRVWRTTSVAVTVEPIPPPPPPPPPVPPLSVQYVDSGNMAEKVTTLDIHGRGFVVVLSVPVGRVLPGDVLWTQGEVQVSNKAGFNTMVTGYLILGDTPTATAGVEVSENNGTNVNPERHHHVISKSGMHAAAVDLGVRYLNFVCRAASTVSTPGSVLKVDQDYGRLSALKVRGATPLDPTT